MALAKLFVDGLRVVRMLRGCCSGDAWAMGWPSSANGLGACGMPAADLNVTDLDVELNYIH